MDGTFLLSITGQLEWVDIVASSGSNYHCKYEVIFGPDWKILTGLEAGVTQISTVSVNNDKVVFNFPIDITFQSTNPYGWPQIILSLYSGAILQGYGRVHLPLQPGMHNVDVPLSKPKPSTILGYLASFFGHQPELVQASLLASGTGNHRYGRVHLPLQPGMHSVDVPLSKPKPSTILGYLASFFGHQPELVQASLLASGTGNHLIQMTSNGQAHFSFNVLTKGFKSLGYDVGTKQN